MSGYILIFLMLFVNVDCSCIWFFAERLKTETTILEELVLLLLRVSLKCLSQQANEVGPGCSVPSRWCPQLEVSSAHCDCNERCWVLALSLWPPFGSSQLHCFCFEFEFWRHFLFQEGLSPCWNKQILKHSYNFFFCTLPGWEKHKIFVAVTCVNFS